MLSGTPPNAVWLNTSHAAGPKSQLQRRALRLNLTTFLGHIYIRLQSDFTTNNGHLTRHKEGFPFNVPA
jgi:hypothetical protein